MISFSIERSRLSVNEARCRNQPPLFAKIRNLGIILVLLVPLLLTTIPIAIPTANALTRVGSLTLNSGETAVQTAVIDTTNGFAYFAACTSPGRIVKIRLSDFSRVGALTLTIGEDCPLASVVDSANGFAYLGTYTNPSRIVKVQLSDLTRVGSIILNTGESFPRSAVIDPVNGFAYFGMQGRVVKIRLSDFTRVGAVLSTGVFTSAVIDTQNGFAYYGTNSNPGVIARIRLSNFTNTAPLTLSSTESFGSAVIDSANGFAYFGSSTHRGVLKVRLSDFTRVGYLLLHPGATEYVLSSAIIDTANGFAYFGTGDSPGSGIVEQVRLSDFTHTGSLTLYPGETQLYSAVFDERTSFGYFGTFQGIVVKVALAPPTAPSPPRNLMATAADSRVTLTWQSPSSDGGSPIIHYRIYRGTVSGSESFVLETGTLPIIVDGGLTNGQTYYYWVTAVNAIGEGTSSYEASAMPTAPIPPTSPTELAAIAGDGQVILGWHQSTSDGGSYITGYRIYRGTISGTLSPITTTIGAVPFYTDSGLTNGIPYFYQVSAVNSAGESPRSNEATATPAASFPQLKLHAGDGAAYDLFGTSVSIDGNTAVIGADQHGSSNSNLGSAYVFFRTGSTWTQQAEISPSTVNNSHCGGSVAISGDTIVIGCETPYNGGSQSAYVYVRTGIAWSYQAKLTAFLSGGAFGSSVSISGDTVLIGDYLDGALGLYSGSAYVYTRTGNSWSQQAKLLAADGAQGDEFGFSVSINGNTVAIGAPSPRLDVNTHLHGSGYVFVRSGTTWAQQAKLNPSQQLNGDGFGRSISISGNTVIVGANGGVYLFDRGGTTWAEETPFVTSNTSVIFGGGYINGDTAVFGAGYLLGGTAFTAALVFTRTNSVWSEHARLIASDATPLNAFGSSISVSGQTIIIGAHLDGDLGRSSGAAYVFGSAPQPTAPSDPKNLQQSSGDTLVTLTWDVPSSDGGSSITGYRIYRGTISGGESLLIQTGNALTFADTALTNGQTYYYKVSAVNSIGEGTMSVEVTATPRALLVNHPITSGGITFNIASDSTISGFQYNPTSQQVSFQVSGANSGVANITLPKNTVSSSSGITVKIDNAAVTPQISQDNNNYYVYLSYGPSTHAILISFAVASAPENPAPSILGLPPTIFSSIIGAVAAIATAIIGLFYRASRARPKTQSNVDLDPSIS